MELGSMVVQHTSCLCTSHFRNSKNVPVMIIMSVLKWRKMFINQTVCDNLGKKQRENSYFDQYQCKDSVRILVVLFRYLLLKILTCLQKYLPSWLTAKIPSFVCSYGRSLWKYILKHIYIYLYVDILNFKMSFLKKEHQEITKNWW